MNVVQGYYKNPAATENVLDKEGWLKTGDMGTRSPDGTLFLRGRSKTMILSASGQNIYPEEIESKLNNIRLLSRKASWWSATGGLWRWYILIMRLWTGLAYRVQTFSRPWRTCAANSTASLPRTNR